MARLSRGFTQEELADLASLDRSYVGQVESNLRNLTLRSVERISFALEFDVRVLFDPDLTPRKLTRLIQTQAAQRVATRS
jgi:transcriptional regulator with XRE-family HTH domain